MEASIKIEELPAEASQPEPMPIAPDPDPSRPVAAEVAADPARRKLICPKCKASLFRSATPDHKLIDACPICLGFWTPEPDSRYEAAETKIKATLLCPKCQGHLAIAALPGSKITFERCVGCRGIWLDREKWKALQEVSPTERGKKKAITAPHSRQEYPHASLPTPGRQLYSPLGNYRLRLIDSLRRARDTELRFHLERFAQRIGQVIGIRPQRKGYRRENGG